MMMRVTQLGWFWGASFPDLLLSFIWSFVHGDVESAFDINYIEQAGPERSAVSCARLIVVPTPANAAVLITNKTKKGVIDYALCRNQWKRAEMENMPCRAHIQPHIFCRRKTSGQEGGQVVTCLILSQV